MLRKRNVELNGHSPLKRHEFQVPGIATLLLPISLNRHNFHGGGRGGGSFCSQPEEATDGGNCELKTLEEETRFSLITSYSRIVSSAVPFLLELEVPQKAGEWPRPG